MTASVCPRCHGPMSGSDSATYCPRCAWRLLAGTDVANGGEDDDSLASVKKIRLGDYELGAELGRGAMGVVYRARQPRLKREVAVKVILASRFAGESARKRFLVEAELAAQLDHPNIVPIYEVGETPDGPFYAMKLVEGGTLAERMSNAEFRLTNERAGRALRGLDIRHSTFVISKVARAVHHAHQRGVLHRDLKPGNILLDAQGEPHVTDFGLARQIGVESSLTVSGSSLGTPAYMAPEQASGERGITTAADIWSLGAILFHLLTGRPPFVGESVADILLQARTQEAPSLRALNPAVSRDLETICLKCLEKDPARRYTSARALAEDLERWLNHEPILARPSTAVERVTKWAQRRPAIAALTALASVLLIVAITGIAWQWRRAESHAEESRQRLVRMATATAIHRIEERDFLGALPWLVEAMRLDSRSRGRRSEEALPRNSEMETPHRIRFATTQRQTPRLVQMWFHDGAVQYARFSADGRRVATASMDGTARIWDALTGQPVTPPLRHARTVNQAVFSLDGLRIATASRDGTARVWDAQTGEPLTPPMVHDMRRDVVLALSPDGDTLVTAAPDSTPVLWNARTGERLNNALGRAGENVDYVLFSPDGHRILTAGYGFRTARLWDATTGKSVGVGMKHAGGIRCVAFSPDGGRILIGGNSNSAEICNATNGATLTPVLRHRAPVAHAEFSRDGNQVLTASFDGTARVWDAVTGQAITPPLQHGESVHHAAFSPDGRWVVTASEDHTVRVWDAASGALVFAPLWHGNSVQSASFSPDGRRVLTASSDGIARLWDLAAAAPDPIPLPGEPEVRRAWLDVVRNSTITANRDNQVQVWSITNGVARGPMIKLNARCDAAALSPDGLRLATGTDNGNLCVWEITTGNMVSTFSPGGGIRHLAWRPDGRQLVVCGGSDEAFLVDPATGLPLRPEPAHHNHFTHAAFSVDGRRVATVGSEGIGHIWDPVTGQPITPPLQHGGVLCRVLFSDDGRLVATTSKDGTARLWNSATGEPVLTPLRHGGWANEVTFSRDGRRLMSTSDDGTARLWDTTTGRPATAPLRLHGGVWCPCISRDGHRLLACNQYFAQVWEGESGTPLTPLLNPHSDIRDIAFSQDERHVLMITSDRRILSWDLTPTDALLDDMAATARLLTSRVLDATGALVPLEQALEGFIPEHLTALLAHSPLSDTNAATDGPSRARVILRRDWERLKPLMNPQQRQAGR